MLEHYSLLGELTWQVEDFVTHYTPRMDHESLNNLMLECVFTGQPSVVLTQRDTSA